MGYRFGTPEPVKPDEVLPIFDVTNNTKTIWSLPCFYLDVARPVDWHDPKLHDHLGWPRPGMPDHVCQQPWEFVKGLSPDAKYRYIDMDKAKKIHWLSDYETFGSSSYNLSLVFDPRDESGAAVDTSDIDCEMDIRHPEDWIIDILINPHIASFAGDPKQFKFNAYISRIGELGEITKDLIVRGKLLVFPG